MSAGGSISYWNVNVPREKWTDVCPDFLQNHSDKVRRVLSTPDNEYHYLSWHEVKEVVQLNQLDVFQRLPSDLRRYLHYTFGIKQRYGSVMDFMMQERLRWQNLTPVGPSFTVDTDIKILYNDWPYGIDPDIVHLVVWTKFGLDDDPATGDLSEHGRQEIDDYVERTFRSHASSDQVTWFKNWLNLKSVEAVEHFHVMLYKPDEAFIKHITNGDVPMMAKVKGREAQASASK